MNSGRLFIISAPSGAGKTTILKQVMGELPGLAFSVSHTTRLPRAGELDGRDYHFVNRETFVMLREAGEFMEWAEVHDNLYGTSLIAVKRQLSVGTDVILDIDVQGAAQVRRQTDLKTVSIFVLPPSLSELQKRLAGRGTDDAKIIQCRLTNALREIGERELYDHQVVNDRLEQAVEMVKAVILATRSREQRGWDGGPLPEFSADSTDQVWPPTRTS